MKSIIYTPIKGFTHQVLIDEVGNFVYRQFLDLGIEPKLAEETVYSMGSMILSAFQKNTVEHMIALYVQQPETDNTDRNASIEGMANEYSCFVIDAVNEAIIDSPLPDKVDHSQLVKIINNSGEFFFNKICELKDVS